MTCITCACGNTDMWMSLEKDKDGAWMLRVYCIECDHLVLETWVAHEIADELLHAKEGKDLDKTGGATTVSQVSKSTGEG